MNPERKKLIGALRMFIKMRISSIRQYYKKDNKTVKKIINGTSIKELKHMDEFLSKIK